MSTILWLVGFLFFAGGLLGACIMDIKEQMVYRYFWLISGFGALLLIGIHIWLSGISAENMKELILFVVLQQWWFARFYGRADCHAYCVCATTMAALGLTLIDYVVHMLLTFVALTIVQVVRKNVESSGKLKKPVALIPYITIAFWVWVDFRCGKW